MHTLININRQQDTIMLIILILVKTKLVNTIDNEMNKTFFIRFKSLMKNVIVGVTIRNKATKENAYIVMLSIIALCLSLDITGYTSLADGGTPSVFWKVSQMQK